MCLRWEKAKNIPEKTVRRDREGRKYKDGQFC